MQEIKNVNSSFKKDFTIVWIWHLLKEPEVGICSPAGDAIGRY